MVVVDSTILLLLLQPNAAPPRADDGEEITEPVARVEQLITDLQKSRERVLLPTPVLAEVLVRASSTESALIVERIAKYSIFEIVAFDQRAAIEHASLIRSEPPHRSPRSTSRRDPAETWAKMKFDRQIVAIARVHNASRVYSDDGGLQKLCRRIKLPVFGLTDLPLPAAKMQRELPLSVSPETQASV